MRRVTPYVVGWAATLLLGVSHAVADPTTEQTLVAMSLLTGEDQKPPVQKPKAPPPGSLGQAPAQPAAAQSTPPSTDQGDRHDGGHRGEGHRK